MPQTPEEKRAAAAARQRRSRERKRLELAGQLASVVDAATGRQSLETAVRRSVEAMKQLADSDGALVATAIETARQIDLLIAANDLTMSSRIFSGQQALTRMLHELGGSPTVRQQFEFRSRKMLPKQMGVVDDGDEDGSAENVTSIRRPERRKRRA